MVLALALITLLGTIVLGYGIYRMEFSSKTRYRGFIFAGSLMALGSLALLTRQALAPTLPRTTPVAETPSSTVRPAVNRIITTTPRPTGLAAALPSPSPRPTWVPCPGAPPSRLGPSDTAYVSLDPDLPNRLRSDPDTRAGTVLTRLYPGTAVTIVKGPTCNEEMVWWFVRLPNAQQVQGWTSEGDSAAYWLIPMRIPPADQEPTDA